jgi:hypothetical protein
MKQINKDIPDKQILDKIKPKLRSSNGRRILRSIFYDAMSSSASSGDTVEAFFTLKDHNVVRNDKTFWSLKNIYLNYDHIPGFEYEFAMDVFGDWDHWCLLADSEGIRDHVQSWRDELTVRLQAKAMKAMLKTALYEGAKGTPAAKFIADRGWEVKRGRPSKAEVERERKIQAGISEDIAEDMLRLGLTVVKGGK